MRIDGRQDDAPDVVRSLRLVYEVAALQRANADIGIGLVSIALGPQSATLTIEQPNYDAAEVDVDYMASRGEALRDALIAEGFPVRLAPPDDGTLGIPSPAASHLHKHAWIMKQVAYGTDPWTVYGRNWAGDLLQIRLSATKYTDAVFHIDGHEQTLTFSVSHETLPDNIIGLNYSLVDLISGYCSNPQHLGQLTIEEDAAGVRVFI
ncbi:hypothetical protein [Planotetraspora sp. GP83]|uniref:hypothetical protein n=1 Tax=Planotetraspora sp. GP83 TaxID=3156264 RepID=UPI0035113E66